MVGAQNLTVSTSVKLLIKTIVKTLSSLSLPLFPLMDFLHLHYILDVFMI